MNRTAPIFSNRGLKVLLPLLLWAFSLAIQAAPQVGDRLRPFPSINECRNKITTPDRGKSMYFTGLTKRKDINQAKNYADQHGLTHVGSVYPKSFIDRGQYQGTADEYRQFQKDFSQVYAERTSGVAYLMLDDDKNAADDSIFYSIEFPAMKNGGDVDKILQFPFTNPPDDPTTATKEYWTKPPGAPRYAKGWCGVHVIHYQIPKGDDKYYLEATMKDADGVEIGHLDKSDATNPVDIDSALPYVLIITAAKPGSSQDPDAAPLQFAYAGVTWTSDDKDHCKFGGYQDGNREGDCGFTC